MNKSKRGRVESAEQCLGRIARLPVFTAADKRREDRSVRWPSCSGPLRKRGAVLLVALVCVSIASAVMYGIVHLALQTRRQVDLEQRQIQAGWILESAVDRSVAKLAGERDYSGEEWSLGAEEIGGRYAAAVRIEVEQIDGEDGWVQVRIVADYPAELPHRVRQTREFRMQLRP